MTATRRLGAPFAGLLALVLLSLGATAAILVTPEPAVSAEAPSDEAFPADPMSFNDQRNARAIPLISESSTVVLPDAGVVTMSSCVPGGALRSGEVLLRVDNRPILALATSEPLWRDLDATAKGSDVLALQAELERLGLDVQQTGVLDRSTRDALKSIQGDAGKSGDFRLSRASILWLPAPEVEVGECSAPLGSLAVAGEPFAISSTTLIGLQLELPADLHEGARVITFGGASVELGDAMSPVTVVDAAFLDAVARSPEFALLESGVVEGEALTIGTSLALPLELLAVPPAAVRMQTTNVGCISVAGDVIPVSVIASSLGQALVQLPVGTERPSQVDAPSSDMAC